MADAKKILKARDIVDLGVLQEANRRYFHPLGLALMLTCGGDREWLTILDSRDDPEGFVFSDLTDDESARKRASVDALASVLAGNRILRFDPHSPDLSVGQFVIQPIGSKLIE
jgi:hypothetical protein